MKSHLGTATAAVLVLRLGASNRYLVDADGELARDLERHGYRLPPEPDIGTLCAAFLAARPEGRRLEVPQADNDALAKASERLLPPRER